MSASYEKRLHFVDSAVAFNLVLKNRLKRVEQAKTLLEAYYAKAGKRNSGGKEEMKRRRDNMIKRYKTKVASLEPTEAASSKEYTRYQDDVELLRRAAQSLRETYGVEARREEEDRKYRKTLKMEFADPETGLVMFDGNLLAAGREEDGFDSLEDAEQEIARLKKLKVKEEDEDAVELLTLVLEEMEEEDDNDKSVWLPSPYVDREVKKKRLSTQSVCAAVAAKNEPCPYVPMTMKQYGLQRQLFSADRWRVLSWRTYIRESDVIDEVEKLEKLFPSNMSTLVRSLLMGMDISPSTLQRVISRLRGKGMKVDDEVGLIEEISE